MADGLSEEHLRRLFATRGQQLYGLGRQLGLPADDAADAVQETMIRLWQAAGQRDIRDYEAYAFGTMYRIAADYHRLARRVARLFARDSGEASVATDPAEDATAASIWLEVERLPPRQRAVIYLRYRVDLSYEDVGMALGITASGARSHAAQAIATLRHRLGEEPE